MHVTDNVEGRQGRRAMNELLGVAEEQAVWANTPE
jgi:hypothetical protein